MGVWQDVHLKGKTSMLRSLVWCCLSVITLGAQAAPAVVEESLSLRIRLGSRSERLETLVVRPAGPGRFPLALIVNGSAGQAPSAMHADWLAHLAHDFAHRGWIAASVVWPGYGRSTGTFDGEAGTCAAPHVVTFLEARANELGAALAALRARADVDPQITLGLGVSIGGAAMLALSAHPDKPLSAVINMSGGVYHYRQVGVAESNCALYQQDLVENMANFGRKNPTPTLWLYAENDPFFDPAFAQRMWSAYQSTGGQAAFLALPAFGESGHTLYKQAANALTQAPIDAFLRRNRLPAFDDGALAPLTAAMSAADRGLIRQYVNTPTEKALVMSGDTQRPFWHYGARTLDDARQQALDGCRQAGDRSCRVLAENLNPVDGWEAALHQAKGRQ